MFINDAISDVIGDIPADVKHKKASEIYPTIFENGVFEKMVTCIEEERQIEYETNFEKCGKEFKDNPVYFKQRYK